MNPYIIPFFVCTVLHDVGLWPWRMSCVCTRPEQGPWMTMSWRWGVSGMTSVYSRRRSTSSPEGKGLDVCVCVSIVDWVCCWKFKAIIIMWFCRTMGWILFLFSPVALLFLLFSSPPHLPSLFSTFVFLILFLFIKITFSWYLIFICCWFYVFCNYTSISFLLMWYCVRIIRPVLGPLPTMDNSPLDTTITQFLPTRITIH